MASNDGNASTLAPLFTITLRGRRRRARIFALSVTPMEALLSLMTQTAQQRVVKTSWGKLFADNVYPMRGRESALFLCQTTKCLFPFLVVIITVGPT